MSLEWHRTRLREIERLARKLATSAECAGTSEPLLVQISVRFHPAGGANPEQGPQILERSVDKRKDVAERMNRGQERELSPSFTI